MLVALLKFTKISLILRIGMNGAFGGWHSREAVFYPGVDLHKTDFPNGLSALLWGALMLVSALQMFLFTLLILL